MSHFSQELFPRRLSVSHLICVDRPTVQINYLKENYEEEVILENISLWKNCDNTFLNILWNTKNLVKNLKKKKRLFYVS